jgi:hypothetical protein
MAPVNATTGNVIPSASVAGTVTITATQAETPKFLSVTSTYTGTYQTIIGKTGPGGGKVFYAAATPKPWGRYLEAAPTDYQVSGVRTSVPWGCNGKLTEATAIEIGTGKANTATILAKCTTAGIAADVANKYSTTSIPNAPGAAGQWFLPSRDELNELCQIYSNGRSDAGYVVYQNGCSGNRSPTGGFAAGYYWSSSESNVYRAWWQLFFVGFQNYPSKSDSNYVRPVRAF